MATDSNTIAAVISGVAVLGAAWISVGIKRRASSEALIASAKISERDQLSEDQQDLIRNLRTDVENLRKWRTEDREECDRQLKAMGARVDAVLRDNEKWRMDSAKWRHLAGNLGIYVNKQTKSLRDAGIEPPQFDGWERFLDEGGDPAEFWLDGIEGKISIP